MLSFTGCSTLAYKKRETSQDQSSSLLQGRMNAAVEISKPVAHGNFVYEVNLNVIWLNYIIHTTVHATFRNVAKIRFQCELVTVLKRPQRRKKPKNIDVTNITLLYKWTWRQLKSVFTVLIYRLMCSGSQQIHDNKEEEKESNFSLWLFMEQWLLLLYKGMHGGKSNPGVFGNFTWMATQQEISSKMSGCQGLCLTKSVSVFSQESWQDTQFRWGTKSCMNSDMKKRRKKTVIWFRTIFNIWKWPKSELKDEILCYEKTDLSHIWE